MEDEQIARMASGMINTLDEDQDGSLSLQDFASIQKHYPDLSLLQLESPSSTPRAADSHEERESSSTPKEMAIELQVRQRHGIIECKHPFGCSH